MSMPSLKPKRFTVVLQSIILFMAIFSSGAISQSDSLALAKPDANLLPEDVVKIVLNALAKNDRPFPDAGIATTFNFASPANKANTGPLERFTQMVKGPVFGVMINHRSYELSEVVKTGNLAYQVISLITDNGAKVHFAIRLGLQTNGKYKGMWMTEAVWPLDSIVQEIGA